MSPTSGSPTSPLLLVEDHPGATPMVEELCRNAGFEPETIPGRAAAVQLLAQPDAPAVVVASFTGAGGQASISLVRELRAHESPDARAARIVAVVDDATQAADAWSAEADEVVVRPYPASRLGEAITDVANRAEASRESIRRDRARIADGSR